MTDLLEKAVAAARGLAPEVQDEIARVVLTSTGNYSGIYHFTTEEAAEQDAADAKRDAANMRATKTSAQYGPSTAFEATTVSHRSAPARPNAR